MRESTFHCHCFPGQQSWVICRAAEERHLIESSARRRICGVERVNLGKRRCKPSPLRPHARTPASPRNGIGLNPRQSLGVVGLRLEDQEILRERLRITSNLDGLKISSGKNRFIFCHLLTRDSS